MSRSGYSDECDDQWAHIRWRGAVTSAMKGKRGQAFLKELLSALDAMPEKKLIKEELYKEGSVCAIGAVGIARGLDMASLDPDDYHSVGAAFGINEKMVQEIVYANDDWYYDKTPEQRFIAMRKWIASEIHD